MQRQSKVGATHRHLISFLFYLFIFFGYVTVTLYTCICIRNLFLILLTLLKSHLLHFFWYLAVPKHLDHYDKKIITKFYFLILTTMLPSLIPRKDFHLNFIGELIFVLRIINMVRKFLHHNQ